MMVTFSCTEQEYQNLFGFGKVPESFFTEVKAYPLSFDGKVVKVVPISFTEDPTDLWGFTRTGTFVFQSIVEIHKPSKEELQAQEAVNKAKESLKAAEDTLKAVKEKK